MLRNRLRELGKMRRQTKVFHMNAKNITSEKEINKVNMSSLYANEFKVMVVKMLDKHL